LPSFLVKWEIDIEADTAREAAEEAHKIHIDAGSEAVIFEVKDKETKVKEIIDLMVAQEA